PEIKARFVATKNKKAIKELYIAVPGWANSSGKEASLTLRYFAYRLFLDSLKRILTCGRTATGFQI
ncbi:MAG TPA: hypothetical protein VMZ26_07245, partial [Pyrinomonadaceae bacterium]|nr:hypothetical protein [Pyrinomonadaceae bacterium]